MIFIEEWIIRKFLKIKSEFGSTNYRCFIELPILFLCSFSLEPHTKSNVRCISYQEEERLERCSTGRLGDWHPLEYTHTGRTKENEGDSLVWLPPSFSLLVFAAEMS